MLIALKDFWKKGIILVAIGVAVSLYMAIGPVELMTGGVIGNSFFIISNVFLIVGLINLVENLGVFNGLKYGTKCLLRIIRGEKDNSETIKEGYIEYVKSRPKRRDVYLYFVFTGVFLIISLILAFMRV